SDLQSSRIAGGLSGHLPERSCGRGKVWRIQIGMIDEVISLGTKLESIFPEEGERLAHGEIPIHQSRCVNIVANAVLQIECSCRGSCPERTPILSGRSEPLRAASGPVRAGKFANVSDRAVLHPELTHRSCRNIGRLAVEGPRLSDSGIVVCNPDGTGKTGLQLRVAANLPSTRHLA